MRRDYFFWYSFTLSAWREFVANMSDGDLDRTRAAIAEQVAKCDTAHAWDAMRENQKKLKIVLAERDRRAGVGQYVPMRSRGKAWR